MNHYSQLDSDAGVDNNVSAHLKSQLQGGVGGGFELGIRMYTISPTRFISVSNALPKTSYVKMIDIWLLFNLTIPFAEVISDQKYSSNFFAKVLLQTYIEYLRGLVEDKKTINHHGREVEVDLDLMTEKPIQVKPFELE